MFRHANYAAMNSIGRYQLLEKLGQGGMGVVYRAFDTLLQRVVAIKVISGSLEAGAEQRERFFREARAAGLLSHRNIITIHDLGEHEGRPYLAMEYLEGEDLQHRRLRPDRMSLARKVELAIEICEGLEYAHARGVVHRDIKPGNIFITDNGTAKILDFGLARLVTSELTNSQMMMGTINYMAPEQVRGERADQRSDIFSVGVVLYELLSGRKPFDGDSVAATMYKILQELPEPLQNIDPGLPYELVAIVERALAKPRDERYQHMAEMLRDLAVYRQQLIGHDTPAGSRLPSGGHAHPSDPPQPPPSRSGSDAPTIAHGSTPFPPVPADPFSGSPPPLTPSPLLTPSLGAQMGTGGQPAPRRWIAGLTAAAILVVAALGLWAWQSQAPPVPQPSAARPAASQPPILAADAAAVETALRQATQALASGDFAEAQRQANAVLALAPDHADARRVRERAASTLESVTRDLKDARAHLQAGRFDEASRTAGSILSVAPGHPEARRLMQDAAGGSRGRGADEARRRMTQAKNAARAGSAATLATSSYNAALDAERTAQRFYDAGQLADATARFYEASGLFRSAELSAQTEAAASVERAGIGSAENERAEAARATAPARPPAVPAATPEPPSVPVTRGALLVADPQLPAPAPPKVLPASGAPSPPTEPSADSLIAEVLTHYEAALENRSLGALKRLWPTLGGSQESTIRSGFKDARRIDVEIASPHIEVAGTTATVTFLRRYDLLTIDGKELSSRNLTTMTLRRAGAAWVIEQIRFDAAR